MKTGAHRKTHIDTREASDWFAGLLRHFSFLFMVLVISRCGTNYLQTWQVKTTNVMILYNSCELGIWEWLS